MKYIVRKIVYADNIEQAVIKEKEFPPYLIELDDAPEFGICPYGFADREACNGGVPVVPTTTPRLRKNVKGPAIQKD